MATTTTAAKKTVETVKAAKTARATKKAKKVATKKVAAAQVATTTAAPKLKDGRWTLPPAGTVMTRPYKGKVLRAKVLADGVLECDGKKYDSLGALTRGVTVGQTDGFQFWFRKEWMAARARAKK
jgi:Protein of unknown function (DUF2924)